MEHWKYELFYQIDGTNPDQIGFRISEKLNSLGIVYQDWKNEKEKHSYWWRLTFSTNQYLSREKVMPRIKARETLTIMRFSTTRVFGDAQT